MLTAEQARQKAMQNPLYQKALNKGIENALHSIECAIEQGREYAVVRSGVEYDYENNKYIYAYPERILAELEKLGYREYTKPVYCGGIRQESTFVTWY